MWRPPVGQKWDEIFQIAFSITASHWNQKDLGAEEGLVP